MNPSKLIAELQHSARLGKTFLVGWLGGSEEKLRIRLKLSTAEVFLSLAILSNIRISGSLTNNDKYSFLLAVQIMLSIQ